MRVLSGPWPGWQPTESPTAITIGVLDGVHLGHRSLIGKLDGSLARTVLTFDPHPIEVLRPGTDPRLITLIEERIELLQTVGVDQVGVLHLAEIKDLEAEEFVEAALVEKLAVKQMVVGHDFRFGRDRTGDVDLLDKLSRRHGYTLEVIEHVTDEEGPISSSRIRSLIEAGAVTEAEAGLGSRFRVSNRVVAGARRGAGIGFPTANMRPPGRKVRPGIGVYAAFARLDQTVHQAAVSVGVRPTFGAGELLIEAYLLDFDQDIYGERLTVELVDYLRPEFRFDTVEELVEAMDSDVEQSRAVLSTTVPSMG